MSTAIHIDWNKASVYVANEPFLFTLNFFTYFSYQTMLSENFLNFLNQIFMY